MDLLVIFRVLLLLISLGTFLPAFSLDGTIKEILGQLSFLFFLYLPSFIFFGVSFFFSNYYLVILPALVAVILQGMIVFAVINSTGSTSALGYLVIPVASAAAYIVMGLIVFLFLWAKGIKI
jgi:hypothetical protein